MRNPFLEEDNSITYGFGAKLGKRAMSKPVTIDNLGVAPSQRYAQDIEGVDKDFFRYSSSVGQQTTVSATSPYISNFEELFGTLLRTPSWASFREPPNFSSHTKNLFSYQLAPSLGSPEKLENDIRTLEEAIQDQDKGQEKEQEKETEEERNKILSMLGCIQRLDKLLELINARKGEFHKG